MREHLTRKFNKIFSIDSFSKNISTIFRSPTERHKPQSDTQRVKHCVTGKEKSSLFYHVMSYILGMPLIFTKNDFYSVASFYLSGRWPWCPWRHLRRLCDDGHHALQGTIPGRVFQRHDRLRRQQFSYENFLKGMFNVWYCKLLIMVTQFDVCLIMSQKFQAT